MWFPIDGRWPSQLVMTVSALIHSGFVLVLYYLAQRPLLDTGEIYLLIMGVIIIGLTYSIASILAEFPSLFSFIQVLTSISTLLLLGTLVNKELLVYLPGLVHHKIRIIQAAAIMS